jgi:hypothetical protein
MTSTKKKRKKVIIGFSGKNLMADKAEDTVNVSALIIGLLDSYYAYREVSGSVALPPITEIARGYTASRSGAKPVLDTEYDDPEDELSQRMMADFIEYE